MPDLSQRLANNPLISPFDIQPSQPGLRVLGVFNPGAFRFGGKIGLLLRVAEEVTSEPGWVCAPILDPEAPGGLRFFKVRRDDPAADVSDPRVFRYRGQTYLTSISHFRLAWSDDGSDFVVDPEPFMIGEGALESFGIEDCRVTQIDERYLLTYTADSIDGHGVGLAVTTDWKTVTRHGMILPPPNKDFALFPEKVGGDYIAFHRPSSPGFGGNYLWMTRSPDLVHWGRHSCVARTRDGMWDSVRIGAGADPIRTDRGWLAIYHGANEANLYCLGLMLFDLNEPERLIARSVHPVMEPTAAYEAVGFFGGVVFTNGHVVAGDTVTVYYGAADDTVCGATFSIRTLLASLE